jgi:hypothetical protein
MNSRFKLALTLLTTRHNKKGFALVMTFMVGAIMVLTAAVIMTRSSQDRTKVTSQKVAFDAAATTDAGVTKILNFLNQPQHRTLIDANSSEWVTQANEMITFLNSGTNDRIKDGEIITTVSGTGASPTPDPNKFYPEDAKLCDNSTSAWADYTSPSPSPSPSASPSPSPSSNYTTVGSVDTTMLAQLLTQDWIPIDSNNPQMGDYRLREYTIDGDKARLKIEARAYNEAGDSNNLSQNNSTRAVEVIFPFSIGTGSSPEDMKMPGFWVSDTNNGSGGDQDNSKQSSNNYRSINAVTWIDCSQKSEWNSNSSYVNDGKIATTPITIGSTTITPSSRVKQIKDNLPGIPPMPSTGVYQFNNLVKINNCYVTLPRICCHAIVNLCL